MRTKPVPRTSQPKALLRQSPTRKRMPKAKVPRRKTTSLLRSPRPIQQRRPLTRRSPSLKHPRRKRKHLLKVLGRVLV